mgnify:CR=1 FL=1
MKVKNDSVYEYYLVREDILPEAIKKTIRVKEILRRHQTRTINEAVQLMDLSRSAFYKYKDYVYPFHDLSQGRIVTFSIMINDRPGIVAGNNASILTINQGIPLQGLANVTMSIETKNMKVTVEELMKMLMKQPGINTVKLIGQT